MTKREKILIFIFVLKNISKTRRRNDDKFVYDMNCAQYVGYC